MVIKIPFSFLFKILTLDFDIQGKLFWVYEKNLPAKNNIVIYREAFSQGETINYETFNTFYLFLLLLLPPPDLLLPELPPDDLAGLPPPELPLEGELTLGVLLVLLLPLEGLTPVFLEGLLDGLALGLLSPPEDLLGGE